MKLLTFTKPPSVVNFIILYSDLQLRRLSNRNRILGGIKANLTSVASRHCISLIAAIVEQRLPTNVAPSDNKLTKNATFLEWKVGKCRRYDLLEKNAINALSFSSVQYLSSVKMTGDASIFCFCRSVAPSSFTRLPARSHDPQSRIWFDDSLTSLSNSPYCPVEVAADRRSCAQPGHYCLSVNHWL